MNRVLIVLSLALLAVYAANVEDSRRLRRSHRNSDSESESEEKGTCGQCEEIKVKGVCRDHYEGGRYQGPRCYKPAVSYYTKKSGCQVAVMKCKRDRYAYAYGPLSLVSSHGDVLFEGQGEEKVLFCDKKGRWQSEDIHGDRQRVKTAYCLEGTQPEYNGNNGYQPQPPVY